MRGLGLSPQRRNARDKTMALPNLPNGHQIPPPRNANRLFVGFRVDQFNRRHDGTTLKAANTIYARQLTANVRNPVKPVHGIAPEGNRQT